MADAEVDIEAIERRWEELVSRARSDPWSLLSMDVDELRTYLLDAVEGLARFVGASAVTIEFGRWRARYYRKSLMEEDEWEEVDGELVFSIHLEEPTGCSITVLSVGLPDDEGPEVFARSAGEIAELFFTGRVCEEGEFEPHVDR